MTNRKTGNQKRKYSFNRYEDIDKCIWKVFDNFGHDEKIENLVYWTRKLKKERAAFRKKAVKYDELQSILEEYNVTPEILRKVLLTGQMFRNQPTLSECIKEWEELNFKWEVHLGWLSFTNKKDDLIINIFVKNMRCYEIINCTDEPIVFSFAFHNLIHKTIKALEKMEDE